MYMALWRIFVKIGCLSQVKESAYLTMEYASDVWNPHHVGDIMELKKVQRRVDRWVLNEYGWFRSVSSMLNQLLWPTLQSRRKLAIRAYVMASHSTFSGQNKHMSSQIKFGQTNLLYIINGNFIELVENNECPDKFWSLS